MSVYAQVLKAFQHDGNGSWTCIAPITIDHPVGRIQVAPGATFNRGTVFMGVDLAAWLEEQRVAARARGADWTT